VRCESQHRKKIYPFYKMARLALGPIQPPVQRVSGTFPWAESGMGRITTHSHLVPRLKMSGTISSLHICLHAIYRALLTKLQILLVSNFDYHIRVRTKRMDENRVLRRIFVSRKEDEPGGYTVSIKN
jgi:hypothetical protein